jgi:hypothetical protein
MKRISILILAFGLFFTACEKDEESNSNPCNDTKWVSQEYPTIRTSSVKWVNTDVIDPLEMESATLRFRVFKTYCDGEVTGDFYSTQEFDRDDFMNTMPDNILEASDGMIYTYRIENDEDQITIQVEFEMTPVGLDPETYRFQRIITGNDLRTNYPKDENGSYILTEEFENSGGGMLFVFLLGYSNG